MLNEMKKIAHRRALRYLRNCKMLPQKWFVDNEYVRVEYVGGEVEELVVEPGIVDERCVCLYENGKLQGAWGIEENRLV